MRCERDKLFPGYVCALVKVTRVTETGRVIEACRSSHLGDVAGTRMYAGLIVFVSFIRYFYYRRKDS